MTQYELNAAAIIDAFNRNAVEYVVICAFAAIAQQAPIPATRDIDLTPSTSSGNLASLSKALDELEARIRVEGIPEGLTFDHDATSLGRATVWNLICRHGEFDLSFFPSAFDGGYAQLAEHARQVSINGSIVVIADLADVIASKEAAGRPKDLQVLPALIRHLRKTQRSSDQG